MSILNTPSKAKAVWPVIHILRNGKGNVEAAKIVKLSGYWDL